MEFQTERLLLRRAKATDAIPLAEIWADREVTRYMGGGARDFEEVRLFVEDEVRAGAVGPSLQKPPRPCATTHFTNWDFDASSR